MTPPAALNTRIADAVRQAQADGTYECTVLTYPGECATQLPAIPATDRKVTITLEAIDPLDFGSVLAHLRS